MAPSRHDWKIVDWDVKPQHNQPTNFHNGDATRNLPIFEGVGIASLRKLVRHSGVQICIATIGKSKKICHLMLFFDKFSHVTYMAGW